MGVGKTLEVFSKVYHLVDCDDFTRHYYRSKYGIDFPRAEGREQNEEQKSSNFILIQTLSFLHIMDSETKKTVWGMFIDLFQNLQRKISSSGWINKSVWDSQLDSTQINHKTLTDPSLLLSIWMMTVFRFMNPQLKIREYLRANS